MTDTLSPRLRHFRHRIFGLTWLSYAGFYLCRKNFGVSMPLLKEDLGYTKDAFAVVLTAYLVMYAIGQFVNGVASDKWGPRLIVGTGLLISVGVNMGLGLASSITLFFILNAVNGMGQSTGWSGNVKIMSAWFRREERGVAMGWWCTCYVVGGFVATNYATFWATNTFLFPDLGWRRGFFFPAATLFLIALAYILFTRNRPSEVGLPEIADEPPESGSDHLMVVEGGPSMMRQLLTNPAIWVAGVMYFFIKLTRYSFLLWLPLYMTEALLYPADKAGYVSSVYELVGFVGVVGAGYLSDRLFGARRFSISALMLFGLALMCSLYPWLSHAGFWLNALGIGLIGMMTFGPDSLMSGPAAMDIGGPNGSATAAGIINGMGSIGGAVSPIVVARVSSTYGWDTLFYFFVVTAIISGLLLATRWNYGGREAA